jgi:hypothetical protein
VRTMDVVGSFFVFVFVVFCTPYSSHAFASLTYSLSLSLLLLIYQPTASYTGYVLLNGIPADKREAVLTDWPISDAISATTIGVILCLIHLSNDRLEEGE